MEIKYFGEQALSYFVNKCKSTFALLTHTHTASDVGADVSGSASAALALAEQYTNEKITELENGTITVLKATQDENGDIIADTYETKADASTKLTEAKAYADNAAAQKSQVQMIKINETDNTTENLSTLKIHKLTQAQYEQMLEDGTIDENSIYLTPDENYSKDDLNEILASKSDLTHNHDDAYETKTDANSKLETAIAYTDSKAVVIQMITWEVDD